MKYKNITSRPLEFLNLFKCLAALIIAVIVHLNKNIPLYSNTNLLFSFFRDRGVFLVEFFFVISGLLFSVSYYDKLKDQKISFGAFILKRIKRLWPALVLSIVYTFIFKYIYYASKGIFAIDLTNLYVSLMFGTSTLILGDTSFVINGAAWYIGVLVFCYFVGAILCFAQSRLKTGKWIFIIPFLAFLPLLFIRPKIPFFNYETARGITAFIIGFYLNDLLKIINAKNEKTRILIKVTCLIATIFFTFLLMYPNIVKRNLNGLVFVIFVFCPLIITCYDLKHLNLLCNNKIIKILGASSYFIYMFNDSIHVTWFGAIDRDCSITNSLGGWYLLIDVVAHIVIGIALYYLIEVVPKIIKQKREQSKS